VRVQNFPGGLVEVDSSSLFPLVQDLKIPYQFVEKSEYWKPNFVVLCVTRTTTSSKHVYTFDLWFLLEKLKCEIPRSVFLQKSLHDLELDFGYVVVTNMCRSFAKICTKLLKKSFYMIYLVLLTNLPR
jgi:hypothetical protein